MKALVLASGGIDSTVLLYEYEDAVKQVLGFDYGSRHNKTEMTYLFKTCAKLGIPFILINVESAFNSFAKVSSLMREGNDLPKNKKASDDVQRSTIVPFRNGILISIATAYAVAHSLNTILIGAHKGDAKIYPDCRIDFITNMNKAIYFGSDNKIRLFAPYLIFEKKEIAKRALKFSVDLSVETYSCYEGSAIHCGQCAACIARRDALGRFDNTKYEYGYYPK